MGLTLAANVGAAALSVKGALVEALRGTKAPAVVLDWQTGAVLATAGDAGSPASPGSAIKPLLLAWALDHGVVAPETQVYCRRDLKVGAMRLPCTHPADQTVFTAESALAESCNRWFAALGRRFTGPQLEAALGSTRLPHSALDRADAEQRELAVLGLRGVTATPMQLALAYREMALHLPQEGAVMQGMLGSVRYGMANPAAVDGLAIAGKTGTAGMAGGARTHGWFAGFLSGRFVLVIYVPRGDGGDAARLAHRFFERAKTEGPPR